MSDRITSYNHAGLTFDVLDEGPLHGDVVVLLHGFPERASCWRDVVPVLHEQGYRTIAPDQRGYSPGARPPRRRDYTTRHLADDVAALVRELGGPVHLVGHDWGAVVAWVVALKHPQLVRTLTAVSVPHPAAYLTSVLTSSQFFKSWYMVMFNLPRLPEKLGAKPGGLLDRNLRRSGMDDDDIARFRAEIVDYGALPGGLGWYRAMPFLDPSLMKARVQAPTTLVWSDSDDFIGRGGVDRTPALVDGDYRLVVLEGVDHWIPTHAAEPVARAILDRISG